jgi:predicted nucleic acid-binding protein
MGLILKSGDSVFLDTAPFIYYFESHEVFFPSLQRFFDSVYQNDVQIVTSLLTLLEISVHPARLGNQALVRKYRDFFTNSENISLFPMDLAVTEQAISLRVKYQLKTPDAIQLGTAMTSGADYILTNDKKWKQISPLPVFLIEEI